MEDTSAENLDGVPGGVHGGVPGGEDGGYLRRSLLRNVGKGEASQAATLRRKEMITGSQIPHPTRRQFRMPLIAQLIREKDKETSLGSIGEKMKGKFDKYWDNEDAQREKDKLNPLLFMAVALDPRFKLKYLEFCFSHIYDREKAKNITKKVEEGLTNLFEWYVADEAASSNISVPANPSLVVEVEEYGDDPSRLWASNFRDHLQVIERKAANNELSRFMAEFCEENREDFDILTWWKGQRNKYPVLSKVAKDVLAVPVSTVASEASFSTGGRVVNPQRSSLSPKMVEALICAQSWLRSSPNKIDIRQTIEDLHKYEELAQELGACECREQ